MSDFAVGKRLARVAVELLADPNLSPRTKAIYEGILIRLLDQLGSEAIDGIKREQIEAYLNSLTDLGVRTHHLHHTVINRLFTFGLERKYLEYNPASHIKRRKPQASRGEHASDESVRYLSEAQLKRLFECAKPHTRLNAILCLLYESGTRIAEVLALNAGDIDFRQRKFQVIGKGNKKRDCYFGSSAHAALERYLAEAREQPHEALFTERLTRSRLVRRLTYVAANRELRQLRAAEPLLRDVKFHDLRHTYATERAQIIPIETLKVLLGHSNIQTTLIYQQITSAKAQSAAQEALSKLAKHW